MKILLDTQGFQLNVKNPKSYLHSIEFLSIITSFSQIYDIHLLFNKKLPNIHYLKNNIENDISEERMHIFDIAEPVSLNDSNNIWRNRASKIIIENYIENISPDLLLDADLFSGYSDNSISTSYENDYCRNICFVPTCYGLSNQIINHPDRKEWLLSIKEKTFNASSFITLNQEYKDNTEEIIQSKFDNTYIIDTANTGSLSFKKLSQRAKILIQEILDKENHLKFNKKYNKYNDKTNFNITVDRIKHIKANNNPSLHDIGSISSALAFNVTKKRETKLFVDISGIRNLKNYTGIQRVVDNILRNLNSTSDLKHNISPVYFHKDSKKYHYDQSYLYNYDKGSPKENPAIEYQKGDVFLGLDFSPNSVSLGKEHLHFMRDAGVRIYFVVYDLLCLQFPTFFPNGSDVIFHNWLNDILEISNGLLCISQTVASELNKWIDINSSTPYDNERPDVDYFYLGSNFLNKTTANNGCIDYPFSSIKHKIPYILMVGTVEPRKAYGQAIDAFELLWKNNININLVIVGKQGWKTEKLIKRILKHCFLNEKLYWYANADDSTLDTLYCNAQSLLAASYGEGFGLPIIEGARQGLPIIARDIPIFREITNNNALYFSGNEGKDISECIISWLSEKKDVRQQCIFTNSDTTWKQSSKVIMQIINKTATSTC